MAQRIINTRVYLANDTLENWEQSTKVLGKGEAAVAFCPVGDTGEFHARVKYGDGVKTFKDLPWSGGDPNTYNKDEIDAILSSVYRYKGTVDTYAELPDDASVGDVYNIVNADPDNDILAGDNVAWDGEDWDKLAGTVDLSGYTTTDALTSGLAGKVDTLENHRLMSDAEGTKLETIAENATSVEASVTNGNIKINGEEKTVYSLPDTVITTEDTFIFDGGNASL